MMSSLYLTCSKSISVGKSAIPWPTFKKRLFSSIIGNDGLRPVKLLLRENGFALIVNLFVLECGPESLSSIVKLVG